MGMVSFDTEKLHELQKKEISGKKHTIMIVDDEDNHLHSMESLLSEEYLVISAKDGREALENIKKIENPREISVIIADQRMPNLTGIELFERIKDIAPRTIRIILTGYDDKNVILDAINRAHTYKFILKPFDPVEFKQIVKRGVEEFVRETERREMQRQCSELKRKNKELFDQLVKSQSITFPDEESEGQGAMKVPIKEGNWQERMKIKPRLLVPAEDAFAPLEDIWEDYI